jgi:hypothetical protein
LDRRQPVVRQQQEQETQRERRPERMKVPLPVLQKVLVKTRGRWPLVRL